MINPSLQTITVEPVVIGNIGSTYGIHGWLRVFSLTAQGAEKIFDYQPWFIKRVSDWQPIILDRWQRHNQDLIIKLKDVKNRQAARLLINCKIVINASQLPELDQGEYYWKDLLGCRVITVSGDQLGEVINIIETGSNDVLVVTDALGKERLIPFIDGQVIKKVDLSVRIIKVDWDPSC